MEKARERADRIVREKRREAETLVKELKSLVNDENAKARETTMRQAREKVKKIENMAPEWVEPTYGGKPLDRVNIGDEVYVPRLKKNANVVEIINDKEVSIQAGIMKVNMKIKDLRAPHHGEKEIARTRHAQLSASKAKTLKSEIDLRGMTGEEAWMDLDKYLDDAVMANIETVRIIHGLGTGVLKKMVYERLKKDPRVKEQRLGGYYEGGAGVTIATLK